MAIPRQPLLAEAMAADIAAVADAVAIEALLQQPT